LIARHPRAKIGAVDRVGDSKRRRRETVTGATSTGSNRPSTASLISAIGNRRMARYARTLSRDSAPTPAPAPPGGVMDAAKSLANAVIKKPVGSRIKAEPADVAIVTTLLEAAGYTDLKLEVAIRRFQRIVVGLSPSRTDGRIEPGGATFQALKTAATTPGGAPTGERARKDFWADDDWENVLPEATKPGHIRRTGAYTVQDKQAVKDRPTLDDPQKTVLASIKANRDALPDLFTDKDKGKSGYSLGDSRPANENATPSAVTNEANRDRKRMKALIWDELGSEAALEGVQTYDDQGWGWGKGWSAKGSMSAVMDNLFALDPDAEELLFDAGIALSANNRGTFKMVNEDTGAIEDGQDAIELMRVSPKLLSIFVTLGTDAAHKQHATDAQWQELEQKAGRVPEYALKWLDKHESTVRFLAHGSHWNPAAGWTFHDYSGTGGDMFKALHLFSRYLARQQPNGAWVVPAGHAFATPGKRIDHWASGTAMAALQAGATKVTVTPAQMSAKPAPTAPAPAPAAPSQSTAPPAPAVPSRPAAPPVPAIPPVPGKPDPTPKAPNVSGHVLIPVTKGWGTIVDDQYWDLGAA
jgi:hypothetical protein